MEYIMYLKNPPKNSKPSITKEGSGTRRLHDCQWRHSCTRSVATRRGTRPKADVQNKGHFFPPHAGLSSFPRGPIAVFALGTLVEKFHCSFGFSAGDAKIFPKSVHTKKCSDSRCLALYGLRPIVGWGVKGWPFCYLFLLETEIYLG